MTTLEDAELNAGARTGANAAAALDIEDAFCHVTIARFGDCQRAAPRHLSDGSMRNARREANNYGTGTDSPASLGIDAFLERASASSRRAHKRKARTTFAEIAAPRPLTEGATTMHARLTPAPAGDVGSVWNDGSDRWKPTLNASSSPEAEAQ